MLDRGMVISTNNWLIPLAMIENNVDLQFYSWFKCTDIPPTPYDARPLIEGLICGIVKAHLSFNL